jgi:dienelactone hydrolase
MEGMGITPQLLRVCERLAHEGFAVAAPDLYWRFGGSNPEAAGTPYAELRHRDGRADIVEVVARLRDLGAATVGITGFCMGGSYAYLAAVSGVDVDAAAPFYGGGIAQHLGDPYCPLLCFFGGRDEWISRHDIALVERAHLGQCRGVRARRARVHARRLGLLRRGRGDRRVEAAAHVLRCAPANLTIRTAHTRAPSGALDDQFQGVQWS